MACKTYVTGHNFPFSGKYFVKNRPKQYTMQTIHHLNELIVTFHNYGRLFNALLFNILYFKSTKVGSVTQIQRFYDFMKALKEMVCQIGIILCFYQRTEQRLYMRPPPPLYSQFAPPEPKSWMPSYFLLTTTPAHTHPHSASWLRSWCPSALTTVPWRSTSVSNSGMTS